MGALGSGSLDEQPGAPSDSTRSSAKPDDALPSPKTPDEPKHSHAGAAQVPDRATIMTIRVKKRDADALAANKMSEEQFFHAAEITSYLGPVILNRAASDYVRIRAQQ
jgi:hypothetical protein